MEKVTTAAIRRCKEDGKAITVLTAYDYTFAGILDESGVDVILVGDSLGNVMLGYDNTLPVTMEDMLHHVKAVSRGVKRAMVVADMPFLSYQVTVGDAVKNAGRFLQEGGAQAVKLEGGMEIKDTVKALTSAGIPVMGHLGLTPQSVHQLGGYRVQGKDEKAARKMIDDAQVLEECGAFSLVLECVPDVVAQKVTEAVGIPTIGIGAGRNCDGQVLVTHDMLGMYPGNMPKFVKQYADLHSIILQAVGRYVQEVSQRRFPAEEHGYKLPEEVMEKLY